MCSGYLRRSSNVRVDMTVQTRKLDGALRDDISKKRVALALRDFVHIYIDFRYAGVTTVLCNCTIHYHMDCTIHYHMDWSWYKRHAVLQV